MITLCLGAGLQGFCPATRRFSQGSALHPATPFEKGVDPKTFLRMATYFLWKGEESGIPDFLFWCRSMDTEHRSFPDTFRRAPPCTWRPLFQKGSIRKLYLRTGNTLFGEGRRTRNAGIVDFGKPIYGHRAPSPLWVFCAFVHGGRHLPKAFGFSTMPPTCTT